jgi:hypothetical protein
MPGQPFIPGKSAWHAAPLHKPGEAGAIATVHRATHDGVTCQANRQAGTAATAP